MNLNTKVLCSTGFIGNTTNEKNYYQIMEYTPLLHCIGFEFMMFRSWQEKIQDIAKDLRSSGISFPVFHAEKGIGESISRNQEGDIDAAFDHFKRNCWLANEIGSEKMVLHLWGGIASDSNIENNFNQLEQLNDIAKIYDI